MRLNDQSIANHRLCIEPDCSFKKGVPQYRNELCVADQTEQRTSEMRKMNVHREEATPTPSMPKGPEGLRAVKRSAAILFALGLHPEGVSLADLSRETGITMTTVHRMLVELRSRHLARETPAGLQALGVGTLVLSGAFLDGLDVRSEARPFLTQLRDATNETCHLGTLASSQIVYIDKIDSRQRVRMTSRVGGTGLAVRTAMGKAILAYSSDDVLDDIIRTARIRPEEQFDLTKLQRELAETRAEGFSTDLEEADLGICCVGAPIMDGAGRVIAGMSVSTPSDRFDRANIGKLGKLVRKTADQISEAMGLLSPAKKESFTRFVTDPLRESPAHE